MPLRLSEEHCATIAGFFLVNCFAVTHKSSEIAISNLTSDQWASHRMLFEFDQIQVTGLIAPALPYDL